MMQKIKYISKKLTIGIIFILGMLHQERQRDALELQDWFGGC